MDNHTVTTRHSGVLVLVFRAPLQRIGKTNFTLKQPAQHRTTVIPFPAIIAAVDKVSLTLDCQDQRIYFEGQQAGPD